MKYSMLNPDRYPRKYYQLTPESKNNIQLSDMAAAAASELI